MSGFGRRRSLPKDNITSGPFPKYGPGLRRRPRCYLQISSLMFCRWGSAVLLLAATASGALVSKQLRRLAGSRGVRLIYRCYSPPPSWTPRPGQIAPGDRRTGDPEQLSMTSWSLPLIDRDRPSQVAAFVRPGSLHERLVRSPDYLKMVMDIAMNIEPSILTFPLCASKKALSELCARINRDSTGYHPLFFPSGSEAPGLGVISQVDLEEARLLPGLGRPDEAVLVCRPVLGATRHMMEESPDEHPSLGLMVVRLRDLSANNFAVITDAIRDQTEGMVDPIILGEFGTPDTPEPRLFDPSGSRQGAPESPSQQRLVELRRQGREGYESAQLAAKHVTLPMEDETFHTFVPRGLPAFLHTHLWPFPMGPGESSPQATIIGLVDGYLKGRGRNVKGRGSSGRDHPHRR